MILTQSFTLPQSVVTLAAAVIGFLAAILGRFIVRWYEKRIRRKKLRAAFVAETRASKEMFEGASAAGKDVVPVHSNFPDDVYQANHSDIGLLAVPEIERLVNYYNLLYEASEQLDPDEPLGELSDFVKTAEDAKQAREEAETVLATHQRWLGNWRFRLSQWRSGGMEASYDDQSQQSSEETDQQSVDGESGPGETEQSTETDD